eukprot:5486729-Alexandrium_andersonii.AAC.1
MVARASPGVAPAADSARVRSMASTSLSPPSVAGAATARGNCISSPTSSAPGPAGLPTTDVLQRGARRRLAAPNQAAPPRRPRLQTPSAPRNSRSGHWAAEATARRPRPRDHWHERPRATRGSWAARGSPSKRRRQSSERRAPADGRADRTREHLRRPATRP